jgi:His/Glu/Gln/Arg/opine family amino acid ABC transporter permease subunit
LFFDYLFIIEKLPYLLLGLKMTVIISAVSVFSSLVLGITGAIIRTLKIPILSQIVVIYVEAIRNTPLLVHIFMIYFGLPTIGITLSAFTSGCIALSIWGGAYAVENFRGGMEAVSKNLLEAGESLGMGTLHLLRYIIVPIGFRISFSSFSNTSISVLKNSSYLTGIGLVELTFTAIDTISVYFKTFEMFFAIGVIYLVLVWAVSYLFHVIEKKLDFNRKDIGRRKWIGFSDKQFAITNKRAD